MSAARPTLRDAALRWIADDPDPATRAELQRVLAAAMVGAPGAVEDLRRPDGRARCASAPPGCAGRCGPGRAGMNVAVVRRATAGAGRLAAPRRGARGAGGGRPRRAARIGGVRGRRRRGAGRRRASRCARCPGRCRRRCWPSRSAQLGARGRGADHRVAQPAGGQRLQGLPGRRGADRAAGGHRDRGGDRGRHRRRSRADRCSTAVSSDRGCHRGLPRPGRSAARAAPARHAAGRAHPDARRRRRHRGARRCTGPGSPTCTWSPSRPRRTRTSRPSRSRTRRSPGRADAAARRWRPRWTPTWRSRSTRTPTGARWPCRPADGAGGCSPATRPACCSATTCCVRRRPRSALPRSAGGHHHRVVVDAPAVAAAHGARYAETLTGFKWIVRGGAGARLRLRGGARLLRRPGRRCATRTASRPPCWPATWRPG